MSNLKKRQKTSSVFFKLGRCLKQMFWEWLLTIWMRKYVCINENAHYLLFTVLLFTLLREYKKIQALENQ